MGYGTRAGLRGSRQLKGRKAALVLVAVEKRGRTTTGRARMAVIPDFKKETLLGFLKDNVEPGSTVYTDGLKSFTGLKEAGFHHVPRSQPRPTDLRKGRAVRSASGGQGRKAISSSGCWGPITV